MLQFSDTPITQSAARADWMALLARAPLSLLEPALSAHSMHAPKWLRAPETGLMMIQGRAGGTGARFNLGEVTVTRCALRLNPPSSTPHVGIAYVLGRSHRQAQLAATADALLQSPDQHAALDTTLLVSIRAHLSALRTQRQDRADSSKVEFFTVARESDLGEYGDQE